MVVSLALSRSFRSHNQSQGANVGYAGLHCLQIGGFDLDSQAGGPGFRLACLLIGSRYQCHRCHPIGETSCCPRGVPADGIRNLPSTVGQQEISTRTTSAGCDRVCLRASVAPDADAPCSRGCFRRNLIDERYVSQARYVRPRRDRSCDCNCPC